MAAALLALERGEEFQGGDQIRDHRGLGKNPLDGVVSGFVSNAARPDGSVNDPSIHQEEEQTDPAAQRGVRPVAGMFQVVFEDHPSVAERLGREGFEVLDVLMAPIMS